MKVLHITNNFPTLVLPIFGIFVKEQVDSLIKAGIDCDLFFINGREKGKIEYIKSLPRIRKRLNENKYDIIHCHHALSALCLVLSGCTGRSKVVVSYQNDPNNEQGKLLYYLIRRFSKAIIIKNNSELVDNKFVFYQPNGVNMNFFDVIDQSDCFSKLNLDSKKRYILFISSNFIRKQKRYDIYQKVVQQLRDKYKMYDIDELLLINTERELVPYYFNASSLHLMTSDYEGSPNSVKEAMACNIPVVSTDVGNVRELLDGVHGSYVSDSQDVDELASLAFKSLNCEGVSSREIIFKKELDIDSVAKRIINIYREIL